MKKPFLYKKATPPSTATVWPVIKSLNGEARKSIVPTRSLGSWTRFKQRSPTRAPRSLIIYLDGLYSESGEDGEIALTLMLSSATSRARVRVKPITPALDVT